MVSAELLVRAALWDGLQPEPILTVSEWAQLHRRLSSKASAEPGAWRNARTPYLVEIMDCLSARSPVTKVVFMKGAQVGGTEAGNNWLGYVIDYSPGPIMMVQPTVETMRRASRQRIEPMIEETPRLKAKIAPRRSRDSENTAFAKAFPGGVLLMTGANSSVGLRSMPARFLFMDEVDGFPGDVDGEGDPVALAERRTATFARRKVFLVSTPTVAGQSRIEREFDKSDQRYFHVPCPECGHAQKLIWGQLKYELDGDGEVAWIHYVCAKCGVLIPETAKGDMLSNGRWVATKPGRKTRGYHLSALYSAPGWYSWAQAAKDFEEAKKDPSKLKTWVNTVLGEVWQERGDAPDWEGLRDRSEPYTIGTVPKGAVLLTAGVDVQTDRLEVLVLGWGPGHESWVIEHRVIPGDPAGPEVWAEMDALCLEQWPREDGSRLSLRALAIDSAFSTQDVYSWVRRKDPKQVLAIRGESRLRMVLGTPTAVDVHQSGKSVKYRAAKVWRVGADVCKAELYGWLRQARPIDPQEPLPPGFVHFPRGIGEEWFRQLTAEERRERTRKDGRKLYEWVKRRERNEALDCFVYGRAALYFLGAHRWKPERWQTEGELATVAPPAKDEQPQQRRPRRGDGFLNRRGPR